jgi:hypothetical protein
LQGNLLAQFPVNAGLISESELQVLRQLPDWTFTTKAYQSEALRLLVLEANSAASSLELAEKLPIIRADLVEFFISRPAELALGRISTTNYSYYASLGRTFSGVEQENLVQNFYLAKTKYTWPISRLDTNRAFHIATQMLAAVKIDLGALTRECSTEVIAVRLEESGGAYFVPDYWVTWRNSGKVMVFVEFIEPTKTIRQFRVLDPRYLLRRTIAIPNLAELLEQTKGSGGSETDRPSVKKSENRNK